MAGCQVLSVSLVFYVSVLCAVACQMRVYDFFCDALLRGTMPSAMSVLLE